MILEQLMEVTEPEWLIACEFEDAPCTNRKARVMIKGCDDDRYRAFCLKHLRVIQDWFEDQKPAYCVCGGPCFDFSDHYNVVRI